MFSKKILLGALVGLGAGLAVSSVFANGFIQDAGPYVGVQGGYTRAYYDSEKNYVESFQNYSVNEGGFGGRLYAGWSFNPYLSVEGGYTQFAKNKYSFNSTDGILYGNGDETIKTNAWDVVGKVSLPLSVFNPSLTGLSLYAKGGAAYVTANDSGSVSVITNFPDADLNNSNSSFDATAHSWAPVYGVGAAYTFSNNFGLDASFTRIQGSAHFSGDSFSPNANLFAVGASYKFDLLNQSNAS
ncbi:MAG: outer membrane beta-barrel protein [Gammaproteobacteria bacterium]